MRKIRIGTRESRLACIQAQIVAGYIRRNCEGYETELVKIVTEIGRASCRERVSASV